MIVKNKKNGTNVLAFKAGVENVRVTIRAGEQVSIPALENFQQVVNKADFITRGWFELIKEERIVSEKENDYEKAEKQVRDYISDEELK